MAMALPLNKYKLKTLDFSKYDKHPMKSTYHITPKTQNPFKTMSDEQWIKYVETREAHFTSDPHYEIIPWEKLHSLESDATRAGWELILRTTNNTAYCPAHVDQDWCQRTQWLFGYPGLQFLVHITYNEDNWSLIETEDKPLQNYFSLHVISTNRIKIKKADYSNYDITDEYDDCESYHDTRYFEMINCPGWGRNGGFMDGKGIIDFKYIFIGLNAQFNSFLGCYSTAHKEEPIKTTDTTDTSDTSDTSLLAVQFPPSFWTDMIEKNRDEIMPGKFKGRVAISDWSDNYVFPGGQFEFDYVLQWHMDFLFMQKFMKSNINNWIENVSCYDCGEEIGRRYWEPELYHSSRYNSYNIYWCENNEDIEDSENSENREYKIHKKLCITETKRTKLDGTVYWIPFSQYNEQQPLFEQDEIRLSANAQNLIDQMWTYIKSVNST